MPNTHSSYKTDSEILKKLFFELAKEKYEGSRMREVICSTCGKIWVCLAEWESKDGKNKQFILCSRCGCICASCYAKKIKSRPELVREMNSNCYPKHIRTINPSRRKG